MIEKKREMQNEKFKQGKQIGRQIKRERGEKERLTTRNKDGTLINRDESQLRG